MTSATAVAPGALLGGRYRLERRIAGGGMATVWLGEDVELDRPVAVKALSDVLATDPGYRTRFRREATVAARLAHPNLVRVFDFGDGERPYLVMEYVAGPSLAKLLGDGGAVAADRLARELLGALGHIHRAGVIHRDIKPGNVLIGRGEASKLTDFGIAQPEDATRITQTGNVIGTLRYMAPEVARGGTATERSDLYSAGVVLAEAAGDRASPELLALIDRLRSSDPDDRPASAEAALAMLDAPTGTASTGVTARIRRTREVEIPLWAVLGGIAALGLIILAVALATSGGGGGGSGASHHTDRGGNGGAGAARATPSGSTSTDATTPAAPAAGGAKPPKEPKPKGEPKPPKERVPPGLAKKGGEPPGHAKKGGD